MTSVMRTPRWIERRGSDMEAHFQALDTDVDNIEAAIAIAQLDRAEQKAAMRRLLQFGAGILATLTTSSILLFLDLVVKGK